MKKCTPTAFHLTNNFWHSPVSWYGVVYCWVCWGKRPKTFLWTLQVFVHPQQHVALHSQTPFISPLYLTHPHRCLCLDQIITQAVHRPFSLFLCRGWHSVIHFDHLLSSILAILSCPFPFMGECKFYDIGHPVLPHTCVFLFRALVSEFEITTFISTSSLFVVLCVCVCVCVCVGGGGVEGGGGADSCSLSIIVLKKNFKLTDGLSTQHRSGDWGKVCSGTNLPLSFSCPLAWIRLSGNLCSMSFSCPLARIRLSGNLCSMSLWI